MAPRIVRFNRLRSAALVSRCDVSSHGRHEEAGSAPSLGQAGRILTRDAFENAIILHAAVGGSTNALLHLPVIAREVGVDITLDALSRFLGSLEIGRTGRAVIMDDTGELIAAPTGSATLREINQEPAAPRVDELGDEVLTHAYDRFRIEGAGHRVIEVGGHRYISAVTPITSAGRHWSTMIVVPEDDFIGFVASNNRKALWMSLMIVAVTTLLASLLVRQGLRADRGARLLLPAPLNHQNSTGEQKHSRDRRVGVDFR